MIIEGQRIENKKEVTISIVKANIYAIILTLPFIVLLTIYYFYNKNILDVFREDVTIPKLGIFLVSMVLLVLVHEVIHGFIWGLFCEKRNSIKIGFIKEYLTPYCHCKEYLFGWQYILGAIAPLVVLGIIPCVIAFLVEDFVLFLLSQIMIMAAGGDLCITLLVLMRTSVFSLVQDHPSKCGCYVITQDGRSSSNEKPY